MPRIPEITDDGASPEQAALFAQERASEGDVYNPTRIYAHRPEIPPALAGLHGALAAGTIPPGLVSLVRVRVAQIHGCPF